MSGMLKSTLPVFAVVLYFLGAETPPRTDTQAVPVTALRGLREPPVQVSRGQQATRPVDETFGRVVHEPVRRHRPAPGP
jgi:hypothetical protein